MGKESNNFSNHPLSQDLSECEMDTFKKDKRSYSHNVGKKNRTCNTGSNSNGRNAANHGGKKKGER
jgi:hypothetical protein